MPSPWTRVTARSRTPSTTGTLPDLEIEPGSGGIGAVWCSHACSRSTSDRSARSPVLPCAASRGPGDYPAIVDIINAARSADGWSRARPSRSLTAYYAHLSNTDPKRDVVIAEVDGSRRRVWPGHVVERHTRDHRSTSRSCFIKPEWRSRGIGAVMLRPQRGPPHRDRRRARPRTEDARVLSSPRPTVVARPCCRRTGTSRSPTTPSWSGRPWTTSPTAHLPDGLEIRPVSEDQVRTIWEADQEAYKDHAGASPAHRRGL